MPKYLAETGPFAICEQRRSLLISLNHTHTRIYTVYLVAWCYPRSKLIKCLERDYYSAFFPFLWRLTSDVGPTRSIRTVRLNTEDRPLCA